MRIHSQMIGCLALVVLGALAGESRAYVVTDNNLLTTSLGDLANSTTTQVSENFAVPTNTMIGLEANVNLTVAPGTPLTSYSVDGLSTSAITTHAGALTTTVAPGALSTYSQTDTLKVDNTGSLTSLYYNLGIGRDDLNAGGNTSGYQFAATGVTLYQPKGADAGLIPGTGGNIVPNASFEDSSINFFHGLGSIIADSAVQGSNVLQIVGTAEVYIPIPVVPGVNYAYSFWYSGNSPGFGDIEYGFSQPGDGFAVGAGNTQHLFTTAPWTEVTGTFTPGVGQTTFFISGMANSGDVELDSLFVAEMPEPASLGLFAIGGVILLRRRRA